MDRKELERLLYNFAVTAFASCASKAPDQDLLRQFEEATQELANELLKKVKS